MDMDSYLFSTDPTSPFSAEELNSRYYGRIIQHVRDLGFHAFEFVIFRCAYGDDDIWSRFLAKMQDDVYKTVRKVGFEDVFRKFLVWTIIEDRETLHGASKDEVRDRFSEWRH